MEAPQPPPGGDGVGGSGGNGGDAPRGKAASGVEDAGAMSVLGGDAYTNFFMFLVRQGRQRLATLPASREVCRALTP